MGSGASQHELAVCGLTLRGVAQGGVRTCLMVSELGAMFDVAPLVPGQLRFDTILVSHGHQDHLGGLPYLCSQRMMLGLSAPRVHAPSEVVAPLQRIFDAWAEIEDFALQADLHGHQPGDTVALPVKGAEATCVRSVHRVPSLCWIVRRTSHRLRPELQGVPGPQLGARRKAGEEITTAHVEDVLAVTGDTKSELWDREPRLRRVKVLVHEVTGWDDARSVDDVREWGHTHVDEIIARAEQFEGEALVLVHRSPRYTRSQAEEVVRTRFPAAVRDRVHVFG